MTPAELLGARAPMFFDEGHGYDVFGLHPPTLAAAMRAGALPYEHYFRVASRDVGRVPARGPTIVVANHGGMLPVDAALLALDLLRGTARIPRSITDHFVPRLPIVSTLFARWGGVSGTPGNVAHLLERGELVVVFPEGVSGPAKPFRERYRLQDWRVGFAELALRFRATVVPVAVVGLEESWPVLARVRFRGFGAPYFPVPMAPLPLPTRVHVRYGEPIALAPDDPEDPARVAAAADRVRTALAALLRATVAARPAVFA